MRLIATTVGLLAVLPVVGALDGCGWVARKTGIPIEQAMVNEGQLCKWMHPTHLADYKKIYDHAIYAVAIKGFALNKGITEDEAKTCFNKVVVGKEEKKEGE